MEIVKGKVSTKGQVTLPKQFREKLNIALGENVDIMLVEDGILIKHKLVNSRMLRGLLRSEIDIDKAETFIREERKKWSLS